LRPIGTGAGGSVFVASRVDERHEDHAEHFALKVPDYDGGAARNLSEEEFEQLFREEARALLSLPRHTNIANFVTFDAGARPKPILVMELVQGPTLEHLLHGGALDMAGALAVIEGIAAGLEAMHEHKVAHLDLKPANIILRADSTPAAGRARPPVPVLVDFGLAGRKLRPGCGSPHYGAPEVWSQKLADATPQPFPADAYAFCCLAYELLTGQVLVNGESMIAVVAAHLSGQAGREALARLARQPGCAQVAELLAWGLHRDAPKRPSMAKLRTGLGSLAPSLRERSWPLGS
jgi:serine/threonine protein kinase